MATGAAGASCTSWLTPPTTLLVWTRSQRRTSTPRPLCTMARLACALPPGSLPAMCLGGRPSTSRRRPACWQAISLCSVRPDSRHPLSPSSWRTIACTTARSWRMRWPTICQKDPVLARMVLFGLCLHSLWAARWSLTEKAAAKTALIHFHWGREAAGVMPSQAAQLTRWPVFGGVCHRVPPWKNVALSGLARKRMAQLSTFRCPSAHRSGRLLLCTKTGLRPYGRKACRLPYLNCLADGTSSWRRRARHQSLAYLSAH
mmetsp:Transcript_7694/g.21902  ORF Transcript_7694/g.21902 Transcript_7694/m.21902 type:complete len:259 (-) Transcript_7694:1078-1854(-)